MPDLNLIIEYIGGNCPVQAEGNINGFPLYFRARGEDWTFAVANKESKNPVEVSVGMADGWAYGEHYSDDDFGAGWMEEAEARAFIDKAAKLFTEQTS